VKSRNSVETPADRNSDFPCGRTENNLPKDGKDLEDRAAHHGVDDGQNGEYRLHHIVKARSDIRLA
jgi:hypothetical protein